MFLSPRCLRHRLCLPRVRSSVHRRYSKVPQVAPKEKPKPAPKAGPGAVGPREAQERAVGDLRPKRAPTVAEEIAYTKRWDAKRMLGYAATIIVSKVLYDAYCNYVQTALYEDGNCTNVLWEQASEETWMEAQRYRLVRQRFGRGVDITGAPEVLKKRSLRYYNTFEYVNEAPMFILRFRYRIWEDIGTLHVAYPIEGVHRRGKLHVRARTRHNKWILEKAWTEDAEMEIELRRRLDLDFLLNPDEDFVVELEKMQKQA